MGSFFLAFCGGYFSIHTGCRLFLGRKNTVKIHAREVSTTWGICTVRKLHLLLKIRSIEKTQNGPMHSQTICLNMIVKNESSVICRSLQSVLPLIDYWVIVDTESTDGTQKCIREFLKDIPGELHERPWVNYQHNRNEALALAKGKGDYVLLMDADDFLEFDADFSLPKLKQDYYLMSRVDKELGARAFRIKLINNQLDWHWEYAIHEALSTTDKKKWGLLRGVRDVICHDGVRARDKNTLYKDIEVLKECLEKEPENARYVYYLAQSYNGTKQYEQALKFFEKRAQMGGFEEEVFWSLLLIGKLQRKLKLPANVVIESYFNAYRYRPTRAEPLYYLVALYMEIKNYEFAYTLVKKALAIPIPYDVTTVEVWIYEYGLTYTLASVAYLTSRYSEALEACNQLVANAKMPKLMQEQLNQLHFLVSAKLGNGSSF